jgi:hypothetical protein
MKKKRRSIKEKMERPTTMTMKQSGNELHYVDDGDDDDDNQ